jgi:hypothetical protein
MPKMRRHAIKDVKLQAGFLASVTKREVKNEISCSY